MQVQALLSDPAGPASLCAILVHATSAAVLAPRARRRHSQKEQHQVSYFEVRDNIVLRPLQLRHAPAYYACARKNLERLRPWFYWATEGMELAETQQYLIDVQDQPEPAVDRPYGIFDGEVFVGSIGLYKIDFGNAIARIGYWIDVRYERRGLITAGARRLIDHAFGDLGLNRIEIRCAPPNTASRAIPQRLGFTEEGLQRQVLAIHGEFQDLIMYAMLSEDWAKKFA